MAELKPCKCGAVPILEEKNVMLGKIEDGAYPITYGRYVCPNCGKEQSWDTAYSTYADLGRENNIKRWNRLVGADNG